MYRYIGNKAKLTPYILDKVQQMIGDTGTVADIMAGTGTVSLELRKKGYKVVASDIMTYSYHHLNVNLCMKEPPEFWGLKDIITDDSQCMYESVLKYLNCIESKKSFFIGNFHQREHREMAHHLENISHQKMQCVLMQFEKK